MAGEAQRSASLNFCVEKAIIWIHGFSTKMTLVNGAGGELRQMETLLLRHQKAIKTVPIVWPMPGEMATQVLDDTLNQ